jgi:hypothetical protein
VLAHPWLLAAAALDEYLLEFGFRNFPASEDEQRSDRG